MSRGEKRGEDKRVVQKREKRDDVINVEKRSETYREM